MPSPSFDNVCNINANRNEPVHSQEKSHLRPKWIKGRNVKVGQFCSELNQSWVHEKAKMMIFYDQRSKWCCPTFSVFFRAESSDLGIWTSRLFQPWFPTKPSTHTAFWQIFTVLPPCEEYWEAFSPQVKGFEIILKQSFLYEVL